MRIIDRHRAARLLASTDGRVFSVVFTKKNGQDRHMNARIGVKKNLTGKGLSFNPAWYELMPVFDMQRGDYRMVNLRTIKSIQVDHEIYTVSNNVKD